MCIFAAKRKTMALQIKFGTDGWRAIIAKEYTVDNLKRVAYATALWMKDKGMDKIVIGHDWADVAGKDRPPVAGLAAHLQITADGLPIGGAFVLRHGAEKFVDIGFA